MNWIDWSVIALFLVSMMAIGLHFSRRAGQSIDSFFVSGRTLKWYIAGSSMVATSFAADTPLWVCALVRQYGVPAVWQYWSPMIGCALAVVLFSRMRRRTGMVTDIEILELRYDGKSAQMLRGLSASMGALVVCPLIIGWVAKAMVTISQEAMGISGQQIAIAGFSIPADLLVTVLVMACALLVSASSGLYGVAYTDALMLLIAVFGSFTLAWLSIQEAGGLTALTAALSSMHVDSQSFLAMSPNITPEVTPGGGTGGLSIWNAVGFFALLWWGNAFCGGYQAQRVLACRDTQHASNALLLYTLVYFGVIAWPWIAVGAASLVILPDMGAAGHDAAYPRMILEVLPAGLRGLMIMALVAAFVSTVQTMFNWGSSYIVNDLYRRFIRPEASNRHYIWVSRLATVLIATAGGVISFSADNIQQLLQIFYVVGAGGMMVEACRWFWWRTNAAGEITAFFATWFFALTMLFGHKLAGAEKPLLDGFMGSLLRLPDGVSFTSDHDTLGARMLLVMMVGLVSVLAGSLCTRAVDKNQLVKFVERTRIFHLGWRPVTRLIEGYVPAQTVPRVLVDWVLVLATVTSLLLALSGILQARPAMTVGLLAVFVVLLLIVLRRTRRETSDDAATPSSGGGTQFQPQAEQGLGG